MTRPLLWAASWLLWLLAALYRAGMALSARDSGGPSWWLLGVLLTILAGYLAWRGWLGVTDTAWKHGWRR